MMKKVWLVTSEYRIEVLTFKRFGIFAVYPTAGVDDDDENDDDDDSKLLADAYLFVVNFVVVVVILCAHEMKWTCSMKERQLKPACCCCCCCRQRIRGELVLRLRSLVDELMHVALVLIDVLLGYAVHVVLGQLVHHVHRLKWRIVHLSTTTTKVLRTLFAFVFSVFCSEHFYLAFDSVVVAAVHHFLLPQRL